MDATGSDVSKLLASGDVADPTKGLPRNLGPARRIGHHEGRWRYRVITWQW